MNDVNGAIIIQDINYLQVCPVRGLPSHVIFSVATIFRKRRPGIPYNVLRILQHDVVLPNMVTIIIIPAEVGIAVGPQTHFLI